MEVGDVVKWIGYPGATLGMARKSPYWGNVGIIVDRRGTLYSGGRVDVAWSDGTFGQNLYTETLEVIYADR